VIELLFNKVQFRQRMGKKSEIDVIFDDVKFKGCLAFVEKLKDIIPMDGFSDPPYVDISPSGLKAGFDIALPDVAVGVFAMQHMAISSALSVPFLGDALTFSFGFCTRENPFVIQIAWYGGGGYFAVGLSPAGLSSLESAMEFGARLSFSISIASGCIEAMGGFYYGLFIDRDANGKETGLNFVLNGYLRLRGSVDVMGLISASMELLLEMEYQSKGNIMLGRATVKFHVSICFFHKTFKATCERRFVGAKKGSGGSNLRLMAAAADEDHDPKLAMHKVMSSGPHGTNIDPWLSYWKAFAA
jgi:hypothetical protein